MRNIDDIYNVFNQIRHLCLGTKKKKVSRAWPGGEITLKIVLKCDRHWKIHSHNLWGWKLESKYSRVPGIWTRAEYLAGYNDDVAPFQRQQRKDVITDSRDASPLLTLRTNLELNQNRAVISYRFNPVTQVKKKKKKKPRAVISHV
jgi:hypothetical protein